MADASHITQAFEAYQWLRSELEEGVTAYNQLLENNGTLKEDKSKLRHKVDEQKERVLRMEGALTYVKEQVADLRANRNAQPPPPPPPGDQATPPPATPPPATPSETTSTGENKKIVVFPDPPVFDGKEKEILYDHWLLRMRNKMTANKKMMPAELLKKSYMQSRVSGNALAQLESRLPENTTRPFTMVNEMLDILTSAFGDPNRKQTARTKYRTLRQGDRDFSDFWAKFQRLAARLDHSKETLIDDLVEKCRYTIQQQLATGEEDPTSLNQLAKRCQRIELSLKKVGRNKLAQEVCRSEDWSYSHEYH